MLLEFCVRNTLVVILSKQLHDFLYEHKLISNENSSLDFFIPQSYKLPLNFFFSVFKNSFGDDCTKNFLLNCICLSFDCKQILKVEFTIY